MAPKVDYPEDWQMHCGEIKQRAGHLLNSELWSDCSFLVGESPNPVVMKAHKLILAMASPVFEAMFYGPIAEGDNSIPIPDIHPEAFKKLLQYIYTDVIELDSFTSACNLYYAAQKYMLPHLLTVCTTYLSCNLTPELACQMYEFGLMVDEKSLVEESEKVIQSETSSILLNKGFEEASVNTVEKIFSMEKLNISNELDLFQAAERYAKALNVNEACTSTTDMEAENMPMTGNSELENEVNNTKDDANNKNDDLPDHSYCLASVSKEKGQEIEFSTEFLDLQCKNMIRKILQKIRFLTLTPSELAEYPTLTSLLTESEILALMMNTASAKTHMSMPEGFSTSRTKRI